MSEIILSKDIFNEEVIDSDVPVLVDFWATWCGPCNMLSPVIKEIAEESDGSYKVGKVNIDEQEALAVEYKIEVIPTLLFFKNGVVVKKLIGVNSKKDILNTLKSL